MVPPGSETGHLSNPRDSWLRRCRRKNYGTISTVFPNASAASPVTNSNRATTDVRASMYRKTRTAEIQSGTSNVSTSVPFRLTTA